MGNEGHGQVDPLGAENVLVLLFCHHLGFRTLRQLSL